MEGRPLRDGFTTAPTPGVVAVLEEASEPAIGEELVVSGPGRDSPKTLVDDGGTDDGDAHDAIDTSDDPR